MELKKPTAAEVVHSLNKVLAIHSLRNASDNAECEPLWAPLMGRNFDVFRLEQCNYRRAASAQLPTAHCERTLYFQGRMLRSSRR